MKQMTLESVVHKYESDTNISDNLKSMTRTSIKYVLLANNVSTPFEINVHEIHKSATRLKWYLIKDRPDLSANTKRNYISFYQGVITWGVANRCIPKKIKNKQSREWQKIAPLIPDDTPQHKGWRSGLRKLGFWASSVGIEPNQITKDHLKDFMLFLQHESKLKHWRITYNGARKDWKRLSKIDVLPKIYNWPALPTSVRSTYCLKLKEWPIEMQNIYNRYRIWCTGSFVTTRDKRYKQKTISADKNLQSLEQIAGYAVNIRDFPKSELSFDIYFDEEIISGYLNWMVDERLNGKQTFILDRLLRVLLGMARGFFKKEYIKHEIWLQQLLDNMKCVHTKNKKDHIVTEEEILQVVEGIKKRRHKILIDAYKRKYDPSSRRQANLVRDELIIRILGARPLRQKNLREMKLVKNLYFKNNGDLRLEFGKSETKAENIIAFSFPSDLVHLLWTYLEKYRPIHLNGYDTNWVFPSPSGSHISSSSVLQIVKNHFQRILGKNVYPHILRDSAAYNYLKKSPGDFLTVQKLLGHKDLKTTINCYSNYDADDAAERFDEFRLKTAYEVNNNNGEPDD